MIDLDRDFRQAEHLQVADLWTDITTRTPGQLPPPQPGRRAMVIVVALVIAVAGIGVAVRAFTRDGRVPATPSPTPTHPLAFTVGPAPDLGVTDAGGTVFDVPAGWYLASYDDRRHGAVVALSDYAPALRSADPCDGMTDDGVLLVIDPVASGPAPPWPVQLTDDPTPPCGTRGFRARWSTHGRTLEATVALGPAARASDADLLETTFASLGFDARSEAVALDGFIHCFGSRFDASLVFASGISDGRAWSLSVDPTCGQGLGLALSGSERSWGGGGSSPTWGSVPFYDLDDGDTFVVGTVPADVATVEQDLGATTALLPTYVLPTDPEVAVYVAGAHGLRTGTIKVTGADGRVREIRVSPGMDCSYPETCSPSQPFVGPIAASAPDDPYRWQIDPAGDSIVASGSTGEVIGRASASEALSASTATVDQASDIQLIFGVASADTAAVLVYPSEGSGWWAAPTVRLEDGRLLYWLIVKEGQAQSVAAVASSCSFLTAVDLAGDPAAVPTADSCRRARGIW